MDCSVIQIRDCVIEGGQLDGQAEIFGSALIEARSSPARIAVSFSLEEGYRG
jgi:hypothetical protein